MTGHARKTQSIPSRHGADLAAGRRIARQLRWLTPGNPEPGRQRWQALGKGLLQGDPAMDRLLEWMLEYGMRDARQLFQQALDNGIDSLSKPPKPLRTFFARIERRPDWVDEALLARGAQACHITGLPGLHALRDAALMGGYQASAINQTLVLTGSLTKGPQRRLAETTKWWLDCTASGGMSRFGDGFKSTLQVRLMHALVRRRVQNMPQWDAPAWGLPINQTDMAATQLGFSVIFLLGSRVLGVPLSRAEGHAVMHLWRMIGWLMGVDERWLMQSEAEGRTLLYQILLSQAPPDASSQQLGGALMDEPLQRYYPHLGWLRGRYARAKHLSVARLFLSAQGMRDLGLPAHILPWYPAVSAPMNFAWHNACGLLPGGRKRLERAGRRAQADYMRVLFNHKPGSVSKLAYQ